jgi:hypothetical protein
MFSGARTGFKCAGLSLILGGFLLVAIPGEAGILDASWAAPTMNADGSPLTDLAAYRVYYGTSGTPCPGGTFLQTASATPNPGPGQTVSVRFTGLSTTLLYSVAVTAVDTSGGESTCSTLASAVARLAIAASPTGTVSFGSVNVGSFVDRVFTVSNTAGGTVSGTVSTSAPFSIVSGSPLNLVGLGATQAVTVRFRPTTSATASANVSFAAGGDIITRLATGTGVGVDTTPPTVAITTPTSGSTYSTRTSSLALAGTASDNVGVTQVTWANSRGGSGTATGTTSWTASGIVLQAGANVLTVTAKDAVGTTKTASVTVTLDTLLPTVAITTPTSGSTYSTPTSLLTLGGTASDNIGVTRVTWANNRGGSGTATGTTGWTASGIILQFGTNVLTVTAQDAVGNTTTDVLTVARMDTFTFTDDPLVARNTLIKTVHVTQVRAAINSVRVARGLAAFAWTDSTLTPGSTPVKVVHLTELRTALNQAYQVAGRTAPTYTDPTVVARLTVMKATHLSELRAAVRTLQ